MSETISPGKRGTVINRLTNRLTNRNSAPAATPTTLAFEEQAGCGADWHGLRSLDVWKAPAGA